MVSKFFQDFVPPLLHSTHVCRLMQYDIYLTLCGHGSPLPSARWWHLSGLVPVCTWKYRLPSCIKNWSVCQTVRSRLEDLLGLGSAGQRAGDWSPLFWPFKDLWKQVSVCVCLFYVLHVHRPSGLQQNTVGNLFWLWPLFFSQIRDFKNLKGTWHQMSGSCVH